MDIENIGVAILTYNAERWAEQQIAGLKASGMSSDQVLVIDSSSKDRTVAKFREFGAAVLTIPQKSFNHGGTRRFAANSLSSYDVIVFLTQDAIPVDSRSIKDLVKPFEDKKVGMTYGRQLPNLQADPIEAHARLFNYPDASQYVTLDDSQHIGSKVTFASDSFAAYRRTALEDIGGFPEDVFFAEDQIVAARLLLKGYSKAYVASAQVYHSHKYTLVEDFKRYFDVGVFHTRNKWLTDTFGRPEGEGKKFVLSEINYLAKVAPFRIPDALLRTVAKYSGYRLGRMEHYLSPKIKQKLSASSYYWKTY